MTGDTIVDQGRDTTFEGCLPLKQTHGDIEVIAVRRPYDL